MRKNIKWDHIYYVHKCDIVIHDISRSAYLTLSPDSNNKKSGGFAQQQWRRIIFSLQTEFN